MLPFKIQTKKQKQIIICKMRSDWLMDYSWLFHLSLPIKLSDLRVPYLQNETVINTLIIVMMIKYSYM